MIVDHYYEKWDQYPPPPQPIVTPPIIISPTVVPVQPQPTISPEEIEEFKRLLERAREYDKKNGEPECELESKKEKLKKLAEELGVEIEFP